MNKALIVTGSRKGLNLTAKELNYLLDKLFTQKNLLVHGDAPGVDNIFKNYAIKHNVPKVDMPADWKSYKGYAGPYRNQCMVDLVTALRSCNWEVMCCAFPGPSSVGTYDCIERLQKNDFKVHVNVWGL